MTQKEKIKDYFKTGRTLTSWDAIQKFNCTRLAAVVDKLKREGMNIESIIKTNKDNNKRYAESVCKDVFVDQNQTSLF